MKVQQENSPYRPITIKLEKQSEAAAFFGIIDKLDCKDKQLTNNERKMLIDLSNIYSNMDVTF